jgi:hypothetical protein
MQFILSAYPLSKGYCIVTVALPKERIYEIPECLRRLFRLPEFRTRALRMGKVVCLTRKRVEYYESDRRVHSLLWPASQA